MRALVLAGGGAKGAFEVGAFERLVRDGARSYDLLTGVSVGALNAAWIAQFPQGEEGAAAESLADLWLGLRTPDVRRPWLPFGRLMALWKPSLYDGGPLHRLVAHRLDVARIRAHRRRVAVGAVSLSTGRYRLFRPDDEHFVEGVLASSAFPAMLPPVLIDGEPWSDGGLRNITPLEAAIDLGATRCDVVIPSPPDLAADRRPRNAVEAGVRALDILLNEIQLTDLQVALRTNELVRAGRAPGKRLVELTLVTPQAPLDVDPLVFEPAATRRLLKAGAEAADRALEAGAGRHGAAAEGVR